MPVHISNGIIQEIFSERDNTFVTVTYRSRPGSRSEQTVRLVVSPGTLVLDANGVPVSAARLRTGMLIDATFSSAMTRSIPPQANAHVIRIVRQQMRDEITSGRILDIDRNNRSFVTISDGDLSSVIRFQVPGNAIIIDRLGRSVNFSRLSPGMRVRVRHANFMTASIPPQTTAFEIRIL